MIYDEHQLDAAVEQLYVLLDQCSVMTFTGPLGAGKTTLVKALLKKCGIKDVITSPTFTYVNVYENKQGQTFYHFDCYRIKTMEDFTVAGFDEYLYQPNSWCFIEWPEIIMPLLTHKVVHIKLDYCDDKRVMNSQVIHKNCD